MKGRKKMPTLKLTLKNSRFVAHNSVNVETFSPTYVLGNGWECHIDSEGTVYCFAERYYRNERHSIKLKIKDGWVKLLLKIGGNEPKALKSYKLDEWPTDGVIGLPGGFIDTRRAFFRENSFQELLDQYGLTAVRCEPANGVYVLLEKFHEGNSIFKEEIEATDGSRELIFNDVKYPDENEENTFTIHREVQVTNANWVIKKVTRDNGILRILYTTDNPKEISNLPKK